MRRANVLSFGLQTAKQFSQMIKAILLIFDPVRSWDTIAQDKRSITFILTAFLLPLLALTLLAEAYGLSNWGKNFGDVIGHKQYNRQEVVVYVALQLVATLLVLFIGAKLLKALGDTFHGRHSYTQAFCAVAYGLSPMFLLRFLDAFPSISPWVPWAIGMILSVAIMYHGVPRVMEPDPPHAFGLYITSALLLAMTSGLARFLTYWWLLGKFTTVQKTILDFVGPLFAR